MVNIRFNYELDCGGHTYSKNFDLSDEDFANDTLLVLVCAYIQTNTCYPGKEIDEYLHNKFPNIHTLDDMYGHSIFNIYGCVVDGLKDFGHICDGLLNLTYDEGERWMLDNCKKYNASKKLEKQDGFSIWENKN